jgi:hypothetical protein
VHLTADNLRRAAPAVPYLAVGVGLYVCRHAVLALALYHLGVAVVLLAARQGSAVRALVRGNSVALLVIASLAGVLGGLFTAATWPWVGLPDFAARLAALGLTPAVLPWFFAYFILVNPAVEESFWRGYLGSPAAGLTWHDLWFAGYHLPVLAFFMRPAWLPLIGAGLLTIAWLWRQIAHRRRGLLVPWVSHLLADAAIVAAVWRLPA